jgi:aromatic-L-amino-acid/L-tryptophan decarboxylase
MDAVTARLTSDEDAWEAVLRRARAWPDAVRTRPVTPALRDADIDSWFDIDQCASPRPLTDLVNRVGDLLERGTLHATHPRYFGLFVPGVRPAGVIGETLASLYNLQLGAWWHAPAAARLEQLALEFFARRFGVDSQTGIAMFTTGGSEANLTAVVGALAAACPRFVSDGLASLDSPPAVYVSDQAHDSITKIARVVGLGDRAVRRVATDAQQRLDVIALAHAIAHDRANGRLPFLVVATAGTTATGAIDPISEIARICRAERLWLHVDAAWGGLAALSARLRPFLAGLEQADSITCDAHKILPVPMGAGMFFCRSRRFTDAVFSVHTSYVPEGHADRDDAYQHTLQWSRRSVGLKVFLTLAELGAHGLEAMVDWQADMADHLRHQLIASGWRVMNHTPLPLVCFARDEMTAQDVEAIMRGVVAEGVVWISSVLLPDGQRWLRACITNPATNAGDVDALVDAVNRARLRS